MFAHNKIKPLKIWSFGFSGKTRYFLKKKYIKGKVKKTVKKYRDQVICNTGKLSLKYLAKPSIIGKIIQADKLNKIAFIN